MIMDAVTLDLNGNSLPTLALDDVSGLAPLTLPEAFLDNRSPSQSGLSSDAVLRFESAMAGTDADGAEKILHSARLVSESFSSVAPEAPAVVTTPGTSAPAAVPTPGAPAPAAAPVAVASAPVAVESAPVAVESAPVAVESVPVAVESAPQVPEAAPVTDQGPEAVAVVKDVPDAPSRVSRLVSAADPVVVDETGDVAEEAVQAAPHVVVAAAVPQAADGIAQQSAQEVAAVSAVTARTEVLVETVNQIVEAVVEQIAVTPALVQGEGEVRMTLKPTVLDGSDITLSAKEGTLTVAVAPATVAAEQVVAAALPRLEIALAEHAPAFRHVEVALAAKKGKIDEVA